MKFDCSRRAFDYRHKEAAKRIDEDTYRRQVRELTAKELDIDL